MSRHGIFLSETMPALLTALFKTYRLFLGVSSLIFSLYFPRHKLFPLIFFLQSYPHLRTNKNACKMTEAFRLVLKSENELVEEFSLLLVALWGPSCQKMWIVISY